MWLVGAGPGDPGLITVRGLELLRSADAVLYDALSHPALLLECRPDADLRDVGKRGGRFSPSQDWITKQLVELARAGARVVRLKGGDSFLFARGAEEAEALVAAGVAFEVIPGLSSPVGTSAFAGIPLTHRDLSSSVTFITGSDKAGQEWSDAAWRKLATATDTICVLMGMRRLGAIASAVVAGGRSQDTPAAVVQWGARPRQRVLTATLGTLAAEVERAGLSNPAVVIIGDVVALRDKLSWYERMPLFGVRILVPRAPHQASATAHAIRLRGAEPILCPVIRIEDPPDEEPLRSAVQRLGQYDWVLFTSPNGVQRFFAEMRRQGLDSRALGGVKLGAIGPKTEAELAPHGLAADLVARSFVGEALAEDVVAEGVGKRVLIPRALVARDELPQQLRAAGAQVDVVPAYRTSGVDAESGRQLADLIRTRSVDVVMFTSGSTVTHTCAALGDAAAELLEHVKVASIGPITSAALAQHAVRVDVEAETYTIDGLLDALEHS